MREHRLDVVGVPRAHPSSANAVGSGVGIRGPAFPWAGSPRTRTGGLSSKSVTTRLPSGCSDIQAARRRRRRARATPAGRRIAARRWRRTGSSSRSSGPTASVAPGPAAGAPPIVEEIAQLQRMAGADGKRQRAQRLRRGRVAVVELVGVDGADPGQVVAHPLGHAREHAVGDRGRVRQRRAAAVPVSG